MDTTRQGATGAPTTQRLVADLQRETEAFRFWHVFRLFRGLGKLREQCGAAQRDYLQCWRTWRQHYRQQTVAEQQEQSFAQNRHDFCGVYYDELRACAQEFAHNQGVINSTYLGALRAEKERDFNTTVDDDN